jgi:hypothetical protein
VDIHTANTLTNGKLLLIIVMNNKVQTIADGFRS